ncbi:glycyl-radical enzyme activating protein [Cohaesibacter haloalkalitolerans]|uniref:glycyl-radical enzyme activating protein n=1 Tax=Cohaesibacter haloalkalitolerans TaxID=1162980 RepID=UPI000E65BF37|nr:glycyl-radical enzyme activating protein [Cohaesibacter haloalkalitolerans]
MAATDKAKDGTMGTVLQMQDYSIHDGDGVRTTIFLAGCGLRCQWCANPESWTQHRKLAYHAHKCRGCQSCRTVCPEGLDPAAGDFDATRCTFCGDCVAACPEKALQLACEQMDADAIMEQIRRDEIFFRHSGGGVTFSGGEPFVQHQFLRSLMAGCERLGVSVWVETCGFFKWEACQDLMAGIDHIFFDIKHMDSESHRRFTGQGNETILDNAKRIHASGVPMTIRIPLIAEVNLEENNLEATARFMRDHLPGSRIELLPYHELGKAKYSAFRMADSFHSFTTPTEAQTAVAYSIFDRYQIERYQ